MRAALLACTDLHLQGALMVNDEELLQGFSRCRELGALPMVGVLVLFASGTEKTNRGCQQLPPATLVLLH